MISVSFIGDFPISDNYPNTKNLIAALQKDSRFQVSVISSAASARLRHSEQKGLLSRLGSSWKMLRAASKSAKQIRDTSKAESAIVFVPYPAILTLYLLSLRSRKSAEAPLLIMDCFISIYDTVVIDRKIFSPGNPISVLLRHLERRAIQRADIVLTDTQSNAAYLQQLYPSPVGKYRALNLCINESLFLSPPQKNEHTEKEDIEVLFVGSFVPLQGVDVIIEAAVLLQKESKIKIRILGEGQTADGIQQMILDNNLDIDWQRGWHSIDRISAAISRADICLGVFGSGAKTSRVLPYKVYMAMANAKPVITAAMDAEVYAAEPIPLVMLEQNNAQQLAAAILNLAQSPEERARLGSEAYSFYLQNLSNERALEGFYSLIQQVFTEKAEAPSEL